MTTFSNLTLRYKKHIPLLAALLITTLVVFFQAFRYSLPLGYAGMFTMIAEDISKANFALPMNVSHYGPGGIPLVYPPLAMYVFALAIKVGVPVWFYLRMAPAVFTLLAVIPLYYLTLELVESKVAGLLAVLFVITQPAVYYTHVWSAGVVRGPALFFCLVGLLFYLRAIRQFSWRAFILCALCLGLLVMTHWLYVLFAALVGLAFLVAEWKPSKFMIALGILFGALLIAAPWLILMLQRHGPSAMLAAYSSHRNADFLFSLQEISAAFQFIFDNLKHVTDNWFLSALALPGLIWLIIRRKFHLPLAFLLILFMGEASFYTEILAGMMAGTMGAEIFNRVPAWSTWKTINKSEYFKFSLAALVVLCIVFSSLAGLRQIIQYKPEINQQSLDMASFVRTNTAPNETYLFVGTINEAEWFPYLFDRTPVFAMWGSEWKGTYAQQLETLIELRSCQLQKSWDCMEKIQQENSVSPTFLVTPNNRWLTQQLKDTHEWDRLYTNQSYLVWKRVH